MTLRLAGAAAALAGAVVLVLLAQDVRAWRDALARDDTVYLAAPERARWSPGTTLGGLAGDLLGVGDDVRARRALRLYRIAAVSHLRLDNATRVQTARSAAQDALLAAPSSQSSMLLGILTFGRSAAGGTEDQLESAASDFTDAIRKDPSNDDAKFDLELLLRSSAAHGTRPGQGVGTGFGRSGHHGAGGGTPGRGY